MSSSRLRLAVLDDLRVDEPADHVVTTRLAPFLNQLVVVGARLHDRIHAVRRDADALVALESFVEPVPQLLSVGSGHTEHRGDHLDGEQRGEIFDRVERGGIELAHIAVDGLAHKGFQRDDSSRREHAVDELAHPLVLRRIQADDDLAHDAGFARRGGLDHVQCDAPRGRERLVIPDRRGDVVVAGQRPEVVLLAVVQRRFVAHPTVCLERHVEVVVRIGVEDDRATRNS